MNNILFIKIEDIWYPCLRGSFDKALDFQSDVHEFNPPMGKLFSILQGFYAFYCCFVSKILKNASKCHGLDPVCSVRTGLNYKKK